MTFEQERKAGLEAAIELLNEAFEMARAQVDARSLTRIMQGLSREVRSFLPEAD